jgi:hypothetical protein
MTNGLVPIDQENFPKPDDSQNDDGILVRSVEGTIMERPSQHSVKLTEGTILVGVRKPSKVGSIDAPLLEVSLQSNSVLLVSSSGGIVHVMNASARGTACKLRLRESQFADTKKRVFAIKPGFEFVAGDRKLKNHDLHPVDGIARRRSQLFGDGRIALSEFSVERLLTGCVLISDMAQKESGTKEKRVIADLSKMATVLNIVNGSQGYTYSGRPSGASQLAGKDGEKVH